MKDNERSLLISKFEKYKGHSSDLFDNEEWAELDAFIAGYKLVVSDVDLPNIVIGGTLNNQTFH